MNARLPRSRRRRRTRRGLHRGTRAGSAGTARLRPAAPGVATRTGPFESGPIAPPDDHVWVGAWVKPAVWGQDGRRAAVLGFEEALGRPLDVVNTYRTFEEEFGKDTDLEHLHRGTTLMVSWASGDTRSIVDGQHDDLIRAQAKRVKKADKPMLMRFRWEMDRPNLRATMWSPEDFIAAWKHVRAIFDAGGREERVVGVVPDRRGLRPGRRAGLLPRRRRRRLDLCRRVREQRLPAARPADGPVPGVGGAATQADHRGRVRGVPGVGLRAPGAVAARRGPGRQGQPADPGGRPTSSRTPTRTRRPCSSRSATTGRRSRRCARPTTS